MTEDQEAELDEQADDVDAEDEVASNDEDDATDDVETADEGAEDVDEEDDEAGLQPGDFVRVAYTARTVEEGTLVDTTDPEVAEEEGIDEQGGEFAPVTIVLGEGQIFEAVEDEIFGEEPGVSGTVSISPGEAFGEYDPDAVETVSADKIDEDDRYPGAHVHIDGRHGYISTIIGGRARVDFNHPLAGEEIEYEYEILEAVEDRAERAAGLLEMYLDVRPDVWIQTDEVEEEVLVEPEEDDEGEGDDEEAGGDEGDDDADEGDDEPQFETETVEKETLYIEAVPQMTMNQQWMFSKQQIGQDVMDKIGVDRIVIQEVIEGMGGMGMPGMFGGMGGGDIEGDLEAALEDADVDPDQIVEELEADDE